MYDNDQAKKQIVFDMSQAQDELVKTLTAARRRRSSDLYWRVALHWEINPLAQLLAYLPQWPKWLWQDRHQNGLIGLDSIWSVTADQYELSAAFESIDKMLAASESGLKVFAGMAFDQRAIDDPIWQNFPAFAFHVPRWEFVTSEQDVSLYLCGQADDLNDIQAFAKQICVQWQNWLEWADEKKQSSSSKGPVRFHIKKNEPEQAVWTSQVDHLIATLNQKPECHKTVLARRRFLAVQNYDAVDVFQAYRQQRLDSFVFAWLPNDHSGFVGASPERLYYRHKNNIHTEALASTVEKHPDPQVDQQRYNELKTSTKLRSEHDYVRAWVAEKLQALCSNIQELSVRKVVEWHKSRHLCSQFIGTLNEGVCDQQIIATLHPTPAVAGSPQQVALDYIQKYENFSRGWYAAPVGWMSQSTAEWTVAIRSGVFINDMWVIYAGSGILADSSSLDEWNETEHKLVGIYDGLIVED